MTEDIDLNEDYDFFANLNQSGDQTIADYTNFRNILFQYSQQFNNSVVNYKFLQQKPFLVQAVKDYMNMFYQLNEKKRLKHVSLIKRKYLVYFYKNTNKINLKVLLKLNLIILEIMNKYGVYDISKQAEMYR
jgi:hypothetical protein